MKRLEKLEVDRIVRVKELAELLSLNPATVYKMRLDNCLPREIPIGRKSWGWWWNDICDWQASR